MGQNTWAEFSPKGGADYLGGQITLAAAKSGAEYLFARIPICSYSGAQPQKPVLGVFLRAAWPGMTNGRGKGRRGPGSAAYANKRRDKNGLLYRDKARAGGVQPQHPSGTMTLGERLVQQSQKALRRSSICSGRRALAEAGAPRCLGK